MTQIITLCDVVVNTYCARPIARSVNQYVMDFAKDPEEAAHRRRTLQEELAHALGYPGQSRISNHERGERTPSLMNSQRLQEHLAWKLLSCLAQYPVGPVSQPVRLDPEIVRDVARALHEVYRDELGKTYSLIEEPELFAELYERGPSLWARSARSNFGLARSQDQGHGATGGAIG